MNPPKLIISGLTPLDEEQLRELLEDAVEFDEPQVPEGTLAEPATITAIIALSSMAIGALAVYLNKSRRSYLLEKAVKVVHPDGRVEEVTLKVQASSSEEAKQQLAAELTKLAAQAAG
ncbi:MAG: hypothetical protein ACKVQW_03230 [Pyrinomonadaceae bacterium]